jgi:glycosyltransferase involved in cell wall biosynthesis
MSATPASASSADGTHLSNPLVSVVVPSYNHGKYIRQTIASIATQSYKPIELVVIDDCSSDDSPARLQEIAKTTDLRLVLKSHNEGLVKTMNAGLNLARGKYFAVCGSDDYWHPDKIAMQVQRLEADPDLRMVFTEGLEVDEGGAILGPVQYTRTHRDRWYFDDVILKADLPPASFMARRADMVAVGGYNEAFRIEDLAMWLALLAGGGYAAVIRRELAYYRSHGANMHNVFSSLVIDQHYAIIDHFSLRHPRRKQILAEWQLRNGNFLAGIDKRRSMGYLLKAIRNVNDYRLFAGLYKNIVRRG